MSRPPKKKAPKRRVSRQASYLYAIWKHVSQSDETVVLHFEARKDADSMKIKLTKARWFLEQEYPESTLFNAIKDYKVALRIETISEPEYHSVTGEEMRPAIRDYMIKILPRNEGFTEKEQAEIEAAKAANVPVDKLSEEWEDFLALQESSGQTIPVEFSNKELPQVEIPPGSPIFGAMSKKEEDGK